MYSALYKAHAGEKWQPNDAVISHSWFAVMISFNMAAVRHVLLRLRFPLLIIIPPLPYTHIPFLYHLSYTILKNDSIVGRFSPLYNKTRWPLGWVEVQFYSFKDLCTRFGVGGCQPHAPSPSTPGKDPIPIVQEAGWAPEPVWTGGKSRHHRDSILDLPARSHLLYRLFWYYMHRYF